jgi:hypothetical protein
VDNLPTPLVKSDTLSQKYGVEVWLKLESQTEVGSFKIRGAMTTVVLARGGAGGFLAAAVGLFGPGRLVDGRVLLARGGPRASRGCALVGPELGYPAELEPGLPQVVRL